MLDINAEQKEWQKRVRESQIVWTVSIAGRHYQRLRYGDEPDDWGADAGSCRNCGVSKGDFHILGCTIEICPLCNHQFVTCCCDADYDYNYERLADYAHRAWCSWMESLFGKSTRNEDGSVTIPKELVARWTRQMNTDYKDLPETEKDSDRKEADKILSLVG